MSDSKIPKSESELFNDAIEKLNLLKDALTFVMDGDRKYLQIISGTLRSLICDTNGNEGILVHLAKKYNFPGKIIRNSGDKMSLEDYLNLPTLTIQTGDAKEVTKTKRKVIQSIAQQEGISHGGTQRHSDHHLFMNVLDIGKSDKTDPYVGILKIWGSEIHDFGNRFIEWSIKNEILQNTMRK